MLTVVDIIYGTYLCCLLHFMSIDHFAEGIRIWQVEWLANVFHEIIAFMIMVIIWSKRCE